MGRLKIRKKNYDKKLIWNKVRHYIDFVILVCCLVVTFNIHPVNNNPDTEDTQEKEKMIYIFHDFAGNEYIMNGPLHGSADSWDYLFDDEVPGDLKWEEKKYTNTVSLSGLAIPESKTTGNNTNKTDNQVSLKDNQVSLEDIMKDLWVDDQDSWYHNANNDKLVVELEDLPYNQNPNEPYYIIIEETWSDNSKMTIEKIDSSEDVQLLSAKIFTFTSDGWVVPILVYWDELNLNKWNDKPIAYIDDSGSIYGWNSGNNKWNWNKWFTWWITIIDDYADCMTPWWYKITHWDSVLAYQQMDNAPNICNIERRFCRDGKLSWTYTQQWCSINKNYTYEKRWESGTTSQNGDSKSDSSKSNTTPDVVQNPDGSVKVNRPLWTGSFVFDQPSQSYTEYHVSDNVRIDEWIEQTTRPHRDCTAPWGEKVKHGNFVQAFKHANWFADAPCEMQIRLCTMWDLMWTFTESTCKTRDASFIDWVNWYPNWDKSSNEKIEWIKKQIKNEQADYEKARKNAKRSTNVDELDKLLYILDKN